MSWEIESQHVDPAEMEHVTVFVERSLMNRSGEPHRYLLQIRLGEHLRLNAQGEILTAEGEVYDHRAKQQEVLAALNAQQENVRAFARRHNVEIFKGGQK